MNIILKDIILYLKIMRKDFFSNILARKNFAKELIKVNFII